MVVVSLVLSMQSGSSYCLLDFIGLLIETYSKVEVLGFSFFLGGGCNIEFDFLLNELC